MVHEDRIRDPSRVRSCLYRIATNLVLNLERRPDVARAEADLGDEVDLDAHHGHEPGPDQDLDAAELHRRIETVLAGPPQDQAQAFRWAVLERMPYAEIAHDELLCPLDAMADDPDARRFWREVRGTQTMIEGTPRPARSVHRARPRAWGLVAAIGVAATRCSLCSTTSGPPP